MKSKHGAMTIEQLMEIDKKIARLHENHAPSVVTERSVGDTLARFLARGMADNPDSDITDTAYIQEYIQSGFTRFTAKRIVVKARALSKTMKARPVEEAARPITTIDTRPVTPGHRISVPAPVPTYPQPATVIPECNITDYVKVLPETLPRPIRTIVQPEERSKAKQINLQNLHNELFLTGTDRFIKQLRYQAPVTSNNPFGLYQLAAPNPEKIRYGAIWDAIGNNDIPPLWFPAILPYLAEEGLLEYYKVNTGLVAELEQARQTYLSDGVLQAYDRLSTFIPKTKPPYAPDGYVCT